MLDQPLNRHNKSRGDSDNRYDQTSPIGSRHLYRPYDNSEDSTKPAKSLVGRSDVSEIHLFYQTNKGSTGSEILYAYCVSDILNAFQVTQTVEGSTVIADLVVE